MKKRIFTLFTFSLFLLLATPSSARVWRVNNRPGVSADFADLNHAILVAAPGDTIYVESSPSSYPGAPLTKKLTILGPGFDLNSAYPTSYTQAIPYPAVVGLTFEPGSAGSVVAGLTMFGCYISESNITLERNVISAFPTYLAYDHDITGDTIRQNSIYEIAAFSGNYSATNIMIYNNIISSIDLSAAINTMNGYIINNHIGVIDYPGTQLIVANFLFQNNIIYDPVVDNPKFPTMGTNNVYNNNIFSNSSSALGIPAGNGNIFDVSDFYTVYLGWGPPGVFPYSQDSSYALKPGSPAIGAGALNGTRVDCGPFGGPAPYIASGMPHIPSIYAFSSQYMISSDSARINVTVSSASH